MKKKFFNEDIYSDEVSSEGINISNHVLDNKCMNFFFYYDIVLSYLRMCNKLIGKSTTCGIFVIVQALLFYTGTIHSHGQVSRRHV